MKKIFFCLSFLFLLPMIASGQIGDAEINFLVGIPHGEFAESLDRTAIGLNAGASIYFGNSAISAGGEFSYMTYGRDRRREYFSPDIPEVSVNVITDYDIVSGLFFLRFSTKGQTVIPYFDGLIGFHYLFTETEIRDEDDFFEPIANDTNFDDFAFAYGAGGGLKILLYRNSITDNHFYLNLKGRYLMGSKADYLQPGSISSDNGTLTYEVSSSTTDMITAQLGIVVTF